MAVNDEGTYADGDYDNPEEKGKPITADEVVARYEAGAKDTRTQQAAYWKAQAFVDGDQWLQEHVGNPLNIQRRAPRHEKEILAVNNRLLPAMVTVMAKLHRRPHVFEVMPSSGDDAAVSGSRLAAAVIADTQRRQRWDITRSLADMIAWKGATALLCVEWDAEAGGTLAYDTTPGEGTEAPERAGDVCVSALSTAEAFCEPGTRDIRTAQWWIKAVAMPPKTARRTYDLDEDPPTDGKAHSKYDASSGSGEKADMTLVLTLYERPGKGCKGQVVTVIDKKIVGEPKPWPFPWVDHLNVTPITAIPYETRWIGQTVLWQAMSLQYLLNRCESALAEHLEAMGKAKLMLPDGSLNADAEWDNDPYQPMPFNGMNGGAPPFYLSPPGMPEWVQRSPEHYIAAIDDVLGVHAISRGQAPSGVESGVALSFLGEQDDTPVGELARVSAAAWAEVACDVLDLYEDKVDETREVQVAQQNGPPQTQQWDGSMLAGQTIATISPDSAAPRSRTAMLTLGMNLIDRGIFGKIGEKDTGRRFAEFVGMAEIDGLMAVIDHAEAKARRVVAQMFAGNTIIPETFDDFATCIRVVNEARLSERYDQANPEIQKTFNDYADACQKLSEEEMVLQRQRAIVDPAMAVAAQANAPALAGNPDALIQMQAEQESVTSRGANVGGADAPLAAEPPPGPGDQDMGTMPAPGEGAG